MGAPTTAAKADLKKPAAVPDSCATYLSLIQQYLAVFQVDNALWLAERCVADYPQCQNAAYLQALCYHRAGKAKNARACLDRRGGGGGGAAAAGRATSSMQFLSAQCSYDLGEYGRGEATLTQTARATYKLTREASSMAMDDWILQTTVRRLH
jgi:hypothetical protein